jgi:hypothetical protein
MKNLLSRLVFLCGTTLILISCDSPTTTENHVSRITNLHDTTLAHFSHSLIPDWAQHKSTSLYDSRKPIIETKGSFTAAGANEVIVAVPYVSTEVPFTKLLLVKVTNDSAKMIEWFTLDCTQFSVKDLNNDGVDEILAEHEGLLSNVTPYKTYELISLKNNEVNVIYQNYSQDESNVFHKDTHAVGDTLSTWIDVRFVDPDGDRIFEISERRKYTRIDDILEGNKVKTTASEDSITIKLF